MLRTIRAGSERDGAGFLPLLAVAFALLLALVSIGFLIFFIHHVAASIQASSILRAIADETQSAIEALFPEELGETLEDPPAAELPDAGEWQPIAAQATGYLQHIAADGLLRFAEEHDAVLRLEKHPGEFVSPGTPLACANRALDDTGIEALRALFAIGDFRTAEQDAGFGIRQIVDIAIKALSPGVNDVSTAVACLDYLGAILRHLALRRLTSPFRTEKATLRVIALAPSFEHFVAKSLDEIRLSAAGNVTILIQVLRVLARVAAGTRDSSRREVLLTHARLAAELADHSIAASYDRARINAELVLSRAPLLASPSTLPALPIKRVHEG